jgi:hypothetical protein
MMQSTSPTRFRLVFSVMGLLLLVAHRISELPSVTSFHLPIQNNAASSFGRSNKIEAINKNDSRLFAKRPENQKRNKKNIETVVDGVPIPANLKRKVLAKRPPLGHVIPEDTRTPGCESIVVVYRSCLDFDF